MAGLFERSRWVIHTVERPGVERYVPPTYVVYSTPAEKARARRAAQALRTTGETLRPVRVVYIPRKRRGCPCLDCRLRYFFSRRPSRTGPPEFLYNNFIPLQMAEKIGGRSFEDGDPRQFVHQRKQQARIAVYLAIKSGRLMRPSTCDLCGRHKDDPALIRAKGNRAQAIEADHLDYREPLNIQWLCSDCHGTATSAWFIAWDFKLRNRYRDHPPPEPWWCWLCRTHHSVCPVMCPVPLGLPISLSLKTLRRLLGLPWGSYPGSDHYGLFHSPAAPAESAR